MHGLTNDERTLRRFGQKARAMRQWIIQRENQQPGAFGPLDTAAACAALDELSRHMLAAFGSMRAND